MKKLIIHIIDGEIKVINNWESVEFKDNLLIIKTLDNDYFVAPLQSIKYYETEERKLY